MSWQRGNAVCVGILLVRLVAFYLVIKLLLGRDIARKRCKLPTQCDPAQSVIVWMKHPCQTLE